MVSRFLDNYRLVRTPRRPVGLPIPFNGAAIQNELPLLSMRVTVEADDIERPFTCFRSVFPNIRRRGIAECGRRRFGSGAWILFDRSDSQHNRAVRELERLNEISAVPAEQKLFNFSQWHFEIMTECSIVDEIGAFLHLSGYPVSSIPV